VVFQDHKLLVDRPIYDNVACRWSSAGTPLKEVDRRVAPALDQVGLLGRNGPRRSSCPWVNSSASGIARAVISKPQLLIADEPTGNLDPGLAVEVMRVFKRFQEVGVTVIIASHDPAPRGAVRPARNRARCRPHRLGHVPRRHAARMTAQAPQLSDLPDIHHMSGAMSPTARGICRRCSARWAGSRAHRSRRCSRSSSSAWRWRCPRARAARQQPAHATAISATPSISPCTSSSARPSSACSRSRKGARERRASNPSR
jgi:hypothetical protein